MVAPGFNPQINKPQLATDVQVNKDIIKADKNQQLGLMLHALGGALRGDKNFVQNTMAIQTMQEGKKKQEERRKNYQEFLGTLDTKSPFYDLSKAMGADKLDQLLLKRYESHLNPLVFLQTIRKASAPTYSTPSLYACILLLYLSSINEESLNSILLDLSL